MSTDIPLLVNSVAHCKDVWPMFFGQVAKYYPDVKIYLMTDHTGYSYPENVEVLNYRPGQMYRDQFLQCIDKVKEDFCLYLSEDCVLYDTVDKDMIHAIHNSIKAETDTAFARFTRGENFSAEDTFASSPYLTRLDSSKDNFFTFTPCVWKTHGLKIVHVEGPRYHIGNPTEGPQFETSATQVCRDQGIKGIQVYQGEPKRGAVHYDSLSFPYIATALVGGRWNFSEYEKELPPLLKEYDIDPHIRGIR